ncbi:MAG: hypothetical protein SGILL_001171 [Bacillariaceae sp.]
MGELDICSRREADRLILAGRILVDGKVVEIGGKVPFDLCKDRVEIRAAADNDDADNGEVSVNVGASPTRFSTVVLHKPVGYVSGQAEHGNPPAIRLLTPSNLWKDDLHESSSADLQPFALPSSNNNTNNWKGFAPAGRLDMNSTGLLVFTKSGVIAKKIIASNTKMEKEYIVDVMPAMQPTRRELAADPNFELPQSTFNLNPLLRGGGMLLGDDRNGRSPLKPCVAAEWITRGEKLRIVLTEGRKHHIRRVCRQLLGWHVNYLHRTRIGPIRLDRLPEGSWRTLQQDEIDVLMAT